MGFGEHAGNTMTMMDFFSHYRWTDQIERLYGATNARGSFSVLWRVLFVGIGSVFGMLD